jgi:hypothetical protein
MKFKNHHHYRQGCFSVPKQAFLFLLAACFLSMAQEYSAILEPNCWSYFVLALAHHCFVSASFPH